jgi:predicted ATPase/signal transduction histidine kinase/DNA-binding NarL/FixJ family response regulator
LDRESGDRVLTVTPAAESPSPSVLARLAREHSIRAKLDRSWALVPLRLVSEPRSQTLVLADPGGLPLERWLGEPMGPERFLDLAIAIASAVRGMHENGVVHRDLTPSSVLLDEAASRAFLTGFGHATSQSGGREAPSRVDVIAGTFAYMAPEQSGRMNRSVDARSDLYSLGVVFYQMVTGGLPFSAREPLEWVYSHVAREPEPPSARTGTVPEPLSALILKLLAKNAEERYQTAAGLEADLRRLREQWRSEGDLAAFPLGAEDTPAHLVIPQKLYGREQEYRALQEALDRVVETGIPRLAMVSGYSGIGKSALVHELMKESSARHTIFLVGKHDQHRQDVPFSTMGQAFGDLVRRILRESQGVIDEWKTSVAAALGRNAGVLVALIPELEWLIGPHPAVLELGPTEARNRFQTAFRRFIQVVATAEHPLVLLVDDLQWIDPASLALLEHMATQRDVRHVLLIGAYRANEVGPSHRLLLALERLRIGETILHEIALEPLRQADVVRLVADATRTDQATASQLAELVHQKTGGNPFFAIQFLGSIAEEKLLTFDRESRTWTSDVAEVASLGYTDNVVDLMVAKLQRLRVAALETLQRFACLGRDATLATLARIQDETEEATAEHLDEAIRAGLVTLSGDLYRFTHDRIQEAAASLIPSDCLPAWHLAIGRGLLAASAPGSLDEALFEIVDHLDQGADLIVDPAERQRLSDLDFAAGRRAKRAIAYAAARSYFEQARRLLAEDAWEARYQQTLTLHLELLECELVAGSAQQADALFHEVLERAASDLDRAEVLGRWMRLHQGIGRAREALGCGLEALELLGISLPDSNEEILSAFLEEQKAFLERLGGRRIEELYDLPVAIDPNARAVMSLLAIAGACAYNAKPTLAPLLYCRALNEALEWGNTEASCMTYISYGSFLVSRGDIPGAAAFAELALRLNERLGDLEQRGTLLYVQGAHVSLWQRHLAKSLPLHEEGFRVCQEVGNLVFANFNATALVTITLEMGAGLDEVIRVARRYASFASESRNEPVRQWIRVAEQLARNLRGETDHVTTLDGGGFTEAHSLEVATKGNFYTGIANLHLSRMIALVFHQHWEEALAAAEVCAATINALRSGPLEATYHFFHALVLASLHEPADEARRQKIREQLARQQEKLGFWARHNPESYRNRHALVAAEIARVDGRDLEAMQLYEQAVESAGENGFVQHAGLASELAARFYLGRGLDRVARAYLGVARDAYRQWGATAVVDRLEREHPGLTRMRPATSERTADASHAFVTKVEHLDLTTVLKASQAVSDEIVLDRLIEKLLQISIEAAGADRGLLLLVEDEAPVIVAEAAADRHGVTVDLSRSRVTSDALPTSALGYVTRTHESVLVDDARAENPFREDRYFARQQPRSVLCLPLLKQGMLVGALYLENRFAPGAFSENRTAVLELLASQAAISLENATLYTDLQREQASIRELNASLERRVAERTAELDEALREQQSILEQLAERTRDLEAARDSADQASRSKSQFLANMSHEIRTPINAITGFTTLALRGGLDAKQARYLGEIQTAARGLLRIIDDLLDLSKIEAGRLDMERIPFRLPEVVQSVVGQVRSNAEAKGLRFLASVAPEVPAELVGDPLRLGQVLLNLCSNAFKFTERGEVELRVELHELKADAARLTFAVRDTGVGLDGAQAEKLFQAFTQADASITRRFGGTGLGLVICKHLVEMMNGRIWLESEPGVGSTFSFVAELSLGEQGGKGETAPIGAPAPARLEEAERLRGVRLLVVEDNAINREIAEELLEHEGAVVRLAENGRCALEIIEREGIDAFEAALVDLQMPEMDGYEVTRRIRRLPGGQRLPVIAVTAHAMHEERARCLAAGMQDHVAKPIDPDVMTGALVRWIGPQRLAQAAARAEGSDRAALRRSEHELPAELPGIDVAAGLTRCSGNQGLYRELLAQFLERHRSAAADLDRLSSGGDRERARRHAHEIRGLAANLGMIDLAASLAALETALAGAAAPSPRQLAQVAADLEVVVAGLEAGLIAQPAPIANGAGVEAGSGVPLGWEPTLRALASCLENGDLGAGAIVAELRARAGGREPEWLTATAAALATLDYEKALATLPRSAS